MTAVELLPPGEAVPSNPRWHELRRGGITASEIAAVLGISTWDSPFSLFWKKANGWITDTNDQMTAGRYVEPAAAEWWMATHDPLENLVATHAGLYANDERPWQLATPDRLLCLPCENCDGSGWDSTRHFDEHSAEVHQCGYCGGTGWGKLVALLECKWVAYSWDGWGEPGTDDIPVHYRAQALWQLDTLGVDEVHFAVLGPGGFRAYGPVRRDEADLDVMRKAGAEFAARLEAGDPPDLDGHNATLGTLKRLHPSAGEGDVEVSPRLALEYRYARSQKKYHEDVIARCEAEIRAALGGDFNRAVSGGERVATRSVYTARRIDAAALRERYPDAAAECVTESTVDKLTPARSKS